MSKKILVTLPFPKSMITSFDDCVKMMEERGFEVILDPRGRALQEAELFEYLPDLYADICSTDHWTAEALAKAPDLKCISRMGVGYETVNVAEASKRKIAVTVTKGANTFDVAEFTFSMILALGRKLRDADKGIRNGEWKRTFGHSLRNKTLGIVGLGAIGKTLVKLVQGFDVKVLAYDAYQDKVFAEKYDISYVSLEELVKNADVITVHSPLTPETRGMIGEKELSMMKPTTIIINCARGGIIDEKALYEALVNKTIAGAGLDVFEKEPLDKDHPLLKLDNVLLSAHTAGMTYEGRSLLVRMAFQNVIDVYEGRVPSGIVNKEIYE